MTDEDWVIITAGGGKWHRREDCEALLAGWEEARALGASTHPARRVPIANVGSRQPCTWCARPSRHSVPRADSSRSPLRTDTHYERVFLDEVLGALPDLQGWGIDSQVEVTIRGVTRRVDFTLTQGVDRIAIEIDGADKGNEAPSYDAWTARQTDLASDGWTVLRFTNRQVVAEQEACRLQIAVLLARLRERHLHEAAPLPALSPTLASEATSEVSEEPLAAASPVSAVGTPGTVVESPSSGSSARAWVVGLLAAAVVLAGLLWWSNQVSKPTQRPNTAQPEAPEASTPATSLGVEPVTAANGFVSCPKGYPVKGNISLSGEQIFHVPAGDFYAKTRPERCFATSAQAQRAGYRQSER